MPTEYEYIQCKVLGHAWRVFGAIEVDGRLDKMVLDCGRCETRRIDFVSSRGEVVKRKRRVPKGYYEQGMKRVDYRKELIAQKRKGRHGREK